MSADLPPLPASASHLPLTQKLGRLVTLSAAETEVLHELQAAGRRVERGREIIAERHT